MLEENEMSCLFKKWLEFKGIEIRGDIYKGANKFKKNNKIREYTDNQIIRLINRYFEESGHQYIIEDVMAPLTNRKKGKINYKKIKADLIEKLEKNECLQKLMK